MTETSPDLSEAALTLLTKLVSKGRMAITPANAADAKSLMWQGYAASWGVPDMGVIQPTPKAITFIKQEKEQGET